VETLRNITGAGFQSIRNMPGIWDRPLAVMRRQAEACIQTAGEHMEHLL
jgi:hypothetical protein